MNNSYHDTLFIFLCSYEPSTIQQVIVAPNQPTILNFSMSPAQAIEGIY